MRIAKIVVKAQKTLSCEENHKTIPNKLTQKPLKFLEIHPNKI